MFVYFTTLFITFLGETICHSSNLLIDWFLQAYDSHCNLVLGEVEETIYTVEEDEEENEIVKVSRDYFGRNWTVADEM